MKAVCLDPGFPGAGRVLKELCKVFEDKAAYFDLNDITSRPHGYETLFLPAWHPSYINIIRQVNASKTCVIWTSPVLQTEFAPVELEYLEVIKSLMQQGLITHLWLGSPDWTSIINVKKGSIFHCSYPITMPKTTVERNRQIGRAHV